MPSQSQTTFAAPGLILGCIVFGLGSLIVKFVDVGSYAIAFWRLFIATPIFMVLIRVYGQSLPKDRRSLRLILLSGMFLGMDLAFWHESIHTVGPGISTLLNSLQIFFIAVLAWLLFHERLGWVRLLSLVIAIIGVAFIAGPEFQHNTSAGFGISMGLASGAMLALAMICIRRAAEIEHTPLFVTMFLVSIGGMLVLLPCALIFDSGSLYPVTGQGVFWTVVYGVVMQCFAWGLVAYSIPLLPLTLTGLLLLSEPVAALILDSFWLHKPINVIQWLGAILTLFAIYLGSLQKYSTNSDCVS